MGSATEISPRVFCSRDATLVKPRPTPPAAEDFVSNVNAMAADHLNQLIDDYVDNAIPHRHMLSSIRHINYQLTGKAHSRPCRVADAAALSRNT
jgi:hypothetical protein